MRNWVVDASPLILLAKVDQIRLLNTLAGELAIPAPVAEEVQAGLEHDAARQWLLSSGRENVRPHAIIASEVAAWDLGRGETATLSWAYRDPAWLAVVDDLAARRCARALGISFTGTIGVLLAAKHKGMISEVGSLLEELERAGLRMSVELIIEARRLAGEL